MRRNWNKPDIVIRLIRSGNSLFARVKYGCEIRYAVVTPSSEVTHITDCDKELFSSIRSIIREIERRRKQ